MRKSASRIVTLSKRCLIEIVRDPLGLIFLVAMPLFMEVLFYFLFHKMTAQFEIRFLAPGIAAFAQAFTALFTGLLIAVDRGTSFLTRLYVSEAKPYEFISGYALSLLPVSLFQSILFFTVGGIIDPTFWSVGMIWGVIFSLITALFFISMGILLGSLCNERSIGGVASIIIAGQSMLSGMWFPTEGLSKGLLTAMKILPFKNATVLLQSASVCNFSFVDFGAPLLIVIGYTLAVFTAAVLVFRHKMKNI